MFRAVTLPAGVPGQLLLHSMPGRWEPLHATWAEAAQSKVTAIVRLADVPEIRQQSPDYADALERGHVPFAVFACEMPDFGVPSEPDAFCALARDMARRIKRGEVVLVHCAAGIGRTGIFAAAVLVALGQSLELAREAVSQAGSDSEMPEQRELVAWCASRLGMVT